MRKQELVYLHVLCSQVRSHVETERGLPDDSFERYEEFGVQPTAIYKSKEDHRRAVDRLLDGLEDALERDRTVDIERSTSD